MGVIVAGFELDATPTEEHGYEADVTENPVESGSSVADNVRPRPETLTIEGIVSDTPIGPIADRRGAGAVPSQDAFAHLLALRDAREPVTIETELRVYDSMVLKSLSIPRNRTTGDALRFRATFVRVNLVQNLRTVFRVAVPRAKKKVNLGAKPAKEPGPQAPAPPTKLMDGSSILYDLFN